MKKCTKCSETKELKYFYKDKAFKDGHRAQCKSCDNKRRLGNPSVKNYDLKRQYGITLSDYETMKTEHNSCCAICGLSEDRLGYSLCVDHNHTSLEVRGLLCKGCNLVVGNAREDKTILLKAIEYLEEYETSKQSGSRSD